jgi:predicted DNA-binding transcriptional regulator AlpA
MNKLLVDAADAAALLGRSERTFHELRKQAGFPGPVGGLGKRMVRWRLADLEAWVASLPPLAATAEPPQLRAGKARKPAWAPLPEAK